MHYFFSSVLFISSLLICPAVAQKNCYRRPGGETYTNGTLQCTPGRRIKDSLTHEGLIAAACQNYCDDPLPINRRFQGMLVVAEFVGDKNQTGVLDRNKCTGALLTIARGCENAYKYRYDSSLLSILRQNFGLECSLFPNSYDQNVMV